MKTQAETIFRKKCTFEVSLRYELLYSLNALLDPNSRIHPEWRKSSLQMLGSEFNKLIVEVGRSWEIWPVLAATLPGPLANPTFQEVIEGIGDISPAALQKKILEGLIHSDEAATSLITKQKSLKRVLSKIPKSKQEWVGHIGLFPYDPKSPQVIALEKLLNDPKRFREIILRILEIYWQKVFRATWERLLPQFRRSLQERERLFHSCSFGEFARQALLRIDVDEAKGLIQAIRGGYRLRFQDIKVCYFLPSAFNDRRFWSAFGEDDKNTTVYFPYFDPSITLDLQPASGIRTTSEPPLDPALIFRALGDSTRFAIATVLARSPKSSVELAKLLSVSKPTISHHVHLLREAGLIQETHVNGSIELQLKRVTLESLSEITVAKLFDSSGPMVITRTRGGAVP
jgi:ArsR family transcriptional regulator